LELTPEYEEVSKCVELDPQSQTEEVTGVAVQVEEKQSSKLGMDPVVGLNVIKASTS